VGSRSIREPASRARAWSGSSRRARCTNWIAAQERWASGIKQDSTRPTDFGGEIKYGVTPALTLDLTVNTDFAQVEVDDQRVNLTRFPIFFPEKRPFFLENAGVFSAGTPQAVDLFFTRRIGISGDGTPQPILDRLGAILRDAMATAAMSETLSVLSAEPLVLTGAEFGQFMAGQRERFGGIIRRLGITAAD
jgi:hypothetical protein